MTAEIVNLVPFIASRELAKPAAALELTVDDLDAIARASAIANRARQAQKRLALLDAWRVMNDAIERLTALTAAHPLEAINLQVRDLVRRRGEMNEAAMSPQQRQEDLI